MDPSDLTAIEDEDSPIMKTIKGAIMGLTAGTIWGTIVASWHDVPCVERSVALPGLIRTLKMCGNYGMTFAGVGGLYIGVEQLMQHKQAKKDFINGAVGAFVAGATVYGYRDLLHLQCFLCAVVYKQTQTSGLSLHGGLTETIHMERNQVVFAESNKDFVDILFNLPTLSLGTIIRLFNKNFFSPIYGSPPLLVECDHQAPQQEFLLPIL